MWAPAGGVTSEWRDGEWYDYIVSYEILSPTTARARLWRGRVGSTPKLTATVLGAATIGSPLAVRFVVIGMNYNQERAANQDQALWFGRWEVFDGERHPNPYGVPGA